LNLAAGRPPDQRLRPRRWGQSGLGGPISGVRKGPATPT
jgi:hypothetical protein